MVLEQEPASAGFLLPAKKQMRIRAISMYSQRLTRLYDIRSLIPVRIPIHWIQSTDEQDAGQDQGRSTIAWTLLTGSWNGFGQQTRLGGFFIACGKAAQERPTVAKEPMQAQWPFHDRWSL